MKQTFLTTASALILLALLSGAIASDGLQSKERKQLEGPPNFQTNPYFAKIDSERGAVLCHWMIMVSVKAVGEKCHAGENQAIDNAIQQSLTDINIFVAANSNRKKEDLEADTLAQLSSAKQLSVCTGDGEAFYQLLTSQGPDGIKASTQHMLEIPRPPVMNPCL